MKVLFDTNILLDVFLHRNPHYEASAYLYDQVGIGKLIGYISPMSVATLFYVGESQRSAKAAKKQIHKVLAHFEVAPAGRAVMTSALELDFDDYEDAMQHEAARCAGADVVLTRNTGDFKNATLSVYTPIELIEMLRTAGSP